MIIQLVLYDFAGHKNDNGENSVSNSGIFSDINDFMYSTKNKMPTGVATAKILLLITVETV
jgi:hypothetical protein